MLTRSRRIPGIRAAISFAAAVVLLSGCNYGFRGGGGFPPDIRTIYIESFENTTPQFELDQLIFRELTERLPRALGVRPAGEVNADAIVRGRITRYEDAALNYRTNAGGSNQVEVLQQQVQVTVAVEIIDRRRNVILWESSTLTGRGDYNPDQQTDQDARAKAVETLVTQIIDGAQSQW